MHCNIIHNYLYILQQESNKSVKKAKYKSTLYFNGLINSR